MTAPSNSYPYIDSCPHQWIPVEYTVGKITWNDGRRFIDWKNSNIINAHRLKVTKLYCPLCDTFINVPSDAKDE